MVPFRFASFVAVAAALTLPCSAQSTSLARQRASIRRQRAVAHPTFVNVMPMPITSSRVCAPLDSRELDQLIGAAARAHQISAKVVREVARQESGFQPCARSPHGAQGLMQLMPATQSTLGVTDPYDPAQSLMAGARFLKFLLERYDGNLALALSAYNAGPARVDATQAIPAIPETREYVSRILMRLQR
jgi:soluble lytic murein transglycosylase-like protein